MIVRRNNLDFLQSILEVKDRIQAYKIQDVVMDTWVILECLNSACVNADVSTFKYLFHFYYYSPHLPVLFVNGLIERVLKYGTVEILEFLREQDLLQVLSEDHISTALTAGNLHFVKWYVDYHHLQLDHESLNMSHFSPIFTTDKHLDLIIWSVMTDHYPLRELVDLLCIAIERKWVELFDLVFSKLNWGGDTRLYILLPTCKWKFFNDVERVGQVYAKVTEFKGTNSAYMQNFQLQMVHSQAYECLQWIYDNGYPIYKQYLRYKHQLAHNEAKCKILFQWLDSFGYEAMMLRRSSQLA